MADIDWKTWIAIWGALNVQYSRRCGLTPLSAPFGPIVRFVALHEQPKLHVPTVAA
jgi:hypothetical protein